MEASTKRNLIISLIADDMVNYKLVSGLARIDLAAHFYYLKLSETIFDLLGLQENEDAYEYYMKRLQETRRILVDYERHNINALAENIYNELERRKANAK